MKYIKRNYVRDSHHLTVTSIHSMVSNSTNVAKSYNNAYIW